MKRERETRALLPDCISANAPTRGCKSRGVWRELTVQREISVRIAITRYSVDAYRPLCVNVYGCVCVCVLLALRAREDKTVGKLM